MTATAPVNDGFTVTYLSPNSAANVRVIDLTPVDPDRPLVNSKEAEWVVIHHLYGKWQRGDRLSKKDLEGLEIKHALACGALIPIKDLPK
jgi:hypothetical protein